MTLGLLSWLIAVPLSIPASYLMTQALAIAIQNEIIYYYTPTGKRETRWSAPFGKRLVRNVTGNYNLPCAETFYVA